MSDERWTPVPDEFLYKNRQGQRIYVVDDELIVEHGSHGIAIDLPDDIRLCKRVSQSAAESAPMLDMLDTLKMAYRKHHLGDDTIGWEELGDTLLNVLCESMGDREFQAWLQRQRPQPAAQE